MLLPTFVSVVYFLVIVNKYKLFFSCLVFPLPHLPALLSNSLSSFCSPGSFPSLISSLLSAPLLTGCCSPLPDLAVWVRPSSGLCSLLLLTWSASPTFLNTTLPLLLCVSPPTLPSLSLCFFLGELYDLDAASLQLKVINYVSGWHHRRAHKHTPLFYAKHL